MTPNFARRLSLILILATLSGCTKSDNQATPTAADTKAESTSTKGIKVGLVLDKGGRDDKSFNSAAFAGASRAVADFKIDLKDVHAPDDASFEPALRTFAERGYPLVIAIGFAQTDAVKKVAPQFPQTHFAIVDGVVDGPNVASLLFAEHEGSYMVGYLAALASKTAKVGFIGGMDVPLIRRFQMGYEAGVKAANPKAEIIVNYVGVNSSAWANPSRAKELALGQYSRDVDVIFHAAGASGLGVFDAAEDKKKLAIGVDSNQNAVKPGRVLSSMLKRVDTAVYEIIKAQNEGSFQAGRRDFGLADKGVDYAVDEHNRELIAPFQERLEKVRGQIVKGDVKVPDYYQAAKSK